MVSRHRGPGGIRLIDRFRLTECCSLTTLDTGITIGGRVLVLSEGAS